jgi:hypothetical protein
VGGGGGAGVGFGAQALSTRPAAAIDSEACRMRLGSLGGDVARGRVVTHRQTHNNAR